MGLTSCDPGAANSTLSVLPEFADVVEFHLLSNVQIDGKPQNNTAVQRFRGASISAAIYEAEEDDDADLFCLCAYALTYFARNQCFVDGNKRRLRPLQAAVILVAANNHSTRHPSRRQRLGERRKAQGREF